MPRQPIISVLGHVNSGKTSLLDRVRSSRIVEGEAGGITQMIGATEVPMETLRDTTGELLEQLDVELTIPGVLFIDTPGHAAFSSLRKRGGSISDIAVLVIDVQDGVQPQTEEALRILQQTGTPFVIALNKIDLLPAWRSEDRFFTRSLQSQSSGAREKLDERIYELMAELNEFDVVADRFDRVDDFTEKVAMVPMSAETGEGIPELLMTIAGLSQRYLADELEVSEDIGRASVLEVSEMEGMGTTIDVIQYDGVIESSDTLVYGTAEGAKKTEIRAILRPKPLTEIRNEREFERVERSEPAAGVRIVGKNLEGVISGSPIRTAGEDEIEKAVEEVEDQLETAEFETDTHGIVVKADSLGSLEAVMDELEEREIRVQTAEVGRVNRSNVVEAADEEAENRAIFAFNTSATEQAEEMVLDRGVKLFEGEVIYEILERYEEWKQELAEKNREKALEAVPRPGRVRVLEQHIFRTSNPAVVGVKVEEGVVKPGSSLMNAEGESIGKVKAVQEENESLDSAEKGDEVALSISNATAGRDFEEGESLYVSLTGTDYRRLQELEDLLERHEKNVLERIVEIQDSENPRWKLQ
jgi:translation initiation factor 5B